MTVHMQHKYVGDVDLIILKVCSIVNVTDIASTDSLADWSKAAD